MSALLRILFLPLLAIPLAAQTITGTLAGTVRDPHSAGIPGATVTVTSNETAAKRSAITNNEGRYTITFLPPGSYNLTASAPGFGKASDKQIQLDVAQTAELDVALP